MEPARIPPVRMGAPRPLRASALALAAAMAVTMAPAEVDAQDSPPPAPERPMRLFTAPEAPDAGPAPTAPPAAPFQESGFLGVSIEDLDAGEAADLGLSEPQGVRIREVIDDSPAAEAGLREGDVILEWAGASVRSVAQLRRLVRETPPGRTVGVSYLRDGERTRVDVTVADGPGGMVRMRAVEMSDEDRREMRERLERAREEVTEVRERWKEQAEEARRRARIEPRRGRPDEGPRARAVAGLPGPRIGVRLSSLTDQLAGYFGLEDRSGALVVSVAEDSPAREAGIRAGDVVLSVAGSRVDSPGDVARRIREHEGEDVEMELLRRGERRTVTVGVPEDGGPAALERRLREIEPAIRRSLERIGPRLQRMEPALRRALRLRSEFII